MLYPRSWQYAIRILLQLARLEPGEQLSARAAARLADVPAAFASKILSVLTAARLVRSRRGPRGGVMLARAPRDISLDDVAHAVGEADALSACILGFHLCSDASPCPLHSTWGPMRDRLRAALLERSLEDLRAIAAAGQPVRRRRP